MNEFDEPKSKYANLLDEMWKNHWKKYLNDHTIKIPFTFDFDSQRERVPSDLDERTFQKNATFEIFRETETDLVVSIYVDYGASKNIIKTASLEKDKDKIIRYLRNSASSVTKDVFLYGNTYLTCNTVKRKTIMSIMSVLKKDTKENEVEEIVRLPFDSAKDNSFEDKLLLISYKDGHVRYTIQYTTDIGAKAAKIYMLAFLKDKLVIDGNRVVGSTVFEEAKKELKIKHPN